MHVLLGQKCISPILVTYVSLHDPLYIFIVSRNKSILKNKLGHICQTTECIESRLALFISSGYFKTENDTVLHSTNSYEGTKMAFYVPRHSIQLWPKFHS